MKSKRTHVLLQLAAGLALLFVTTRVWVTFALSPDAAAVSQVLVTGQRGIPALLPVAIAMLAMAVTLSISGRVVRVVLGALLTVMGAWVAIASAGVATGGAEAMFRFGAASLQEAMGLAPNDHAELVSDITLTVWPGVAMALGCIIAVVGIASTVLGWSWRAGGAKYASRSSTTPANTGDRISDWDALSDGDDPSEHDGIDSTPADGSPNSGQKR